MTFKKRVPRAIFDYYKDGEVIYSGTKEEMAEYLNLSPGTIAVGAKGVKKRPKLEYRVQEIAKKQNYAEYAYYKDDELIGIGTIDELVEISGLSPHTLNYYATTHAYEKGARSILIRVDTGEEDA